jgi:hypothetical protein
MLEEEPSGEGRAPIHTRVLRASEPAWEEWLAEVPRDVYHSAAYHGYSAASGEGDAYLVVTGDRDCGLAWPYLLRQIPDGRAGLPSGLTDVTSVYGYAGPLAWGCAPGEDFLEKAWLEVLDVWRSQCVVSAFTRFHPLLGNEAFLSSIPWPGDGGDQSAPVAPLGRTISIDLTLSDEAARADYSSSLRRQIKNYRQAGLTTTYDPDMADLPEFTRLYHETMDRNEADRYYFFDLEQFRQLRDALGDHLHLLVTRLGDELGAACLFTEYDGIVQEHLMAANGAMAAISPYKVLIDDARAWARERGNRVLHLGGGRGAREDSLFEFKRRFSSRRHTFYTGRWIVDREAYAGLVEEHVAESAGAGQLVSGYFPAYRAPLRGADEGDGDERDGDEHETVAVTESSD